jgi:pSer/pThr/pTyr-binding forkhead associated (FHA) protein
MGHGGMQTRRYGNREVLFARGDSAEAVFEVRAGRVRLSWPGPSGLALTSILGVGQVVGEVEFLSGGHHAATAEAVGETVVSVLSHDDLAEALRRAPNLAPALLRPVFERLRQETAPPPAARGDLLLVPTALTLRPADPELARQMDAQGLRIASLPFRVGRRSSRDDAGEASADLRLEDTRPYTLSRRHFAIEAVDGDFVVRDCGSHHGTIVNGARIGGALPESVAPLFAGENSIVAGRQSSPFRFTLLVQGGPTAG